MPHKSIRRLNSKLAQNPQLSEHNKEVLNEFFAGLRSSKDSDSNKKTVSSGFSMIAGDIDFRLDEPEKSDIERIVGDLNEDIITREDGKPYAIDTKETIYNALTKFYTQFIKAEGEAEQNEILDRSLTQKVLVNRYINALESGDVRVAYIPLGESGTPSFVENLNEGQTLSNSTK